MKKLLLSTVCGLVFATGVAQAQIVVRVGPPPPVHERIPPPPHEHPDWAWHSGYHHWDGNKYVWTPGVYEAPPHAHAHWVAGHWDHHHDGYVWIEGHWS
jgi:hypothetical protein